MGKQKDRSCGIGGQAVLEGVMMKNKDKCAVAILRTDGKIQVEEMDYKGILPNSKIRNLPFIRGMFSFVESLLFGTKCITYSASFFEEEDVKEETKIDKTIDKMFGGKAEDVVIGITVMFSIIMAVALFMVLPYFLSELLSKYIHTTGILTLVEGCIRIGIFIIYVVAISLMKDIQRVYKFHGAEHKCINCIERGRVLNVSNVMKSSRIHKRCGTSFMLFVMFVSVIIFFFITVESRPLRLALRLLLLPIISGISYEIIRLAGNSNNIFVRIISAPGMWLQRLTTKEPDEEMVKTAIASVEAVFDWKNYFKEQFQYDVESSSQVEEMEDDEFYDSEVEENGSNEN